jgi:hypothetical protein
MLLTRLRSKEGRRVAPEGEQDRIDDKTVFIIKRH